MGTVWGKETKVSREVLFMRKSIADNLRWAGSLMLCRQPWTKSDKDSGEAKRCSYCYDEVLKQTKNSRCKHCFGTGFEGGYRPAFIVRAQLQNNTANHDSGDNSGLKEEQRSTIKLACDGHIYGSGDLFAEIIEMKDNRPTKIGRVFQLSGDIMRQTVQGLVSADNPDAIMNLTDRMISQQGTVKLLLRTDERVLCSNDFWGVDHEGNPQKDSTVIPFDDTTYADRYHMSSWGL